MTSDNQRTDWTAKLRGARHDVLAAARRLNSLVAEFPDDPTIWVENLYALCDCVDRMIVAETEINAILCLPKPAQRSREL